MIWNFIFTNKIPKVFQPEISWKLILMYFPNNIWSKSVLGLVASAYMLLFFNRPNA